MCNFYSICLAFCLGGLLTGFVSAETFTTTTGQTLSGDAVSFNEKGLVIRTDDGNYADRIDWAKFDQATLAKLAKIPKAQPFAEPLLETTEDEKTIEKEKAAVVIKTDYEKLVRPAPGGLLKGIFSTGIGILFAFLIYGANIYAAYEISIFRARSPGVVCGVSAVVPILGPIIFLAMPTQIVSKEGVIQEPAFEKEAYYVGEPPPEEGSLEAAELVDTGPKLPAAQVFTRGQTTFNRRFIETKFPGFFGMVRRDSEKDLIMTVKAARGTYIADKITRVGPNEMHIQTHTGGASQEITVPFLEIQEIVLKHRDA